MYDLVLSGGLVVDGTRAKPYPASVCIQGGKISKITSEPASGAEVLDVSGLVVAPGFIDIHSHSDASPLVDYPVESKLARSGSNHRNCGKLRRLQPSRHP